MFHRTLAVVLIAISAMAATIPTIAQQLEAGGTFIDDDGSVHEGAIEALVVAGITSGCMPEYFCTSRLLTRGEMAAFLARALELEPGSPDAFTDDTGHLFEGDINAIANAQITLGCRTDAYCPDENVTRAQMASFLVRAFDVSAGGADAFIDDDESIHEASIDALAASGITEGCNELLFCPSDRVPRDQMASFLARALGLDPVVPPPRTPQLCRTEVATGPSGQFLPARGAHEALPGSGTVWTYRVDVEQGLGIDPDCVAASVQLVLTHPELGWGADGSRSFERIESGAADFVVTLAFPSTTDGYCLPLNTGGIFSCWNGSRAMLNSWRWESGATAYSAVDQYRIYLINHEVGHALGFGHRSCPGAGEPAPVMMQQTKGVGSCVAHPWP